MHCLEYVQVSACGFIKFPVPCVLIKQESDSLGQHSGQTIRTPFMEQSGLILSAGKATMCLHTGMTDAFVWDPHTPQERFAGTAETRQILREIDEVFRRHIGHLIYSHKVLPNPASAYLALSMILGMIQMFASINHHGIKHGSCLIMASSIQDRRHAAFCCPARYWTKPYLLVILKSGNCSNIVNLTELHMHGYLPEMQRSWQHEIWCNAVYCK